MAFVPVFMTFIISGLHYVVTIYTGFQQNRFINTDIMESTPLTPVSEVCLMKVSMLQNIL